MKAKLFSVIVLATVVLAAPRPSLAVTIYYYTGPTFASATGVFSTSMSISGYLTFESVLGSNTQILLQNGATEGLQYFSFTDGLHVISIDNSTQWEVNIATDSAGNIDQWRIDLQKFNRDNPSLQYNVGIVTCFNPPAGGSGGVCGEFAARGTGGNDLFTDLGVATNISQTGSWSVVPVPNVGTGLPGLVAAAALLAWWRKKRATKLAA